MHIASNCISNGRYKKCNLRHHTLLHVSDEEYVESRQCGACVNGPGAHSAKVEEVSQMEDKFLKTNKKVFVPPEKQIVL